MASLLQKILGMNDAPATETGAALQDVDQGLADAKAQAAKRQKLAELQQKLANLKAQREQVAAEVEAKKEKRAAITDDEIVRMAKVKGIKDEDVKAYINGRISQRNYKLSQDSINATKDAAAAEKANQKATEDAAKAEEIRQNRKLILELEQKITENSVKLASGNKGEKASAMAANRTLMNQYEDALEDYKDLNDGKEWVSNMDLEENDNAGETGGKVEDVEIPEDVKLDETEMAEFNSYGADTDKKNALIAQKRKDARVKAENDVKRQNQLSGIKSDLKALGVNSGADIAKKLYDKKLDNDPILKPVKDRVLAFIRSDKEYNTIKKLETLWGK